MSIFKANLTPMTCVSPFPPCLTFFISLSSSQFLWSARASLITRWQDFRVSGLWPFVLAINRTDNFIVTCYIGRLMITLVYIVNGVIYLPMNGCNSMSTWDPYQVPKITRTCMFFQVHNKTICEHYMSNLKC